MFSACCLTKKAEHGPPCGLNMQRFRKTLMTDCISQTAFQKILDWIVAKVPTLLQWKWQTLMDQVSWMKQCSRLEPQHEVVIRLLILLSNDNWREVSKTTYIYTYKIRLKLSLGRKTSDFSNHVLRKAHCVPSLVQGSNGRLCAFGGGQNGSNLSCPSGGTLETFWRRGEKIYIYIFTHL